MLVTLHNLLCKEWTTRHCILIITKAMTLLISFSNDIEAILVAKVVPYRVVRIVTCAHGIDVQPLHQLDILKHSLTCNNIATVWVHLMTVDSLEENRLTIDQHLRVFDFNLAETNFERDCFNSLTRLGIFNIHIEIIKIRSLCCPLLWVS